jgi:hypothetical protein
MWIPAAALAAGCAFALGAHESGLFTGLACLAPAAVAFALLCTGRYPAERAVLRLSRPPGGRRRMRPRRRSSPVEMRLIGPRGGSLVGSRIAGRPPPALLAALR